MLTDVTNASRTMLLDLDSLDWDDELLALFGVPRSILPTVVPSSGELAEGELLGARVPLTGLAGDQQAALFGQACLETGLAKVTYGTGSFVLANAGTERGAPPDGVLQTVAWRLGDARRSTRSRARSSSPAPRCSGSGTVSACSETRARARRSRARSPGTTASTSSRRSTGLGAPHWAPEARGLLTGLTRGTGRAHLVRAALEAIAFQTADVLDCDGAAARARCGPTAARPRTVPRPAPGRPRPRPRRGVGRAGGDCARCRRAGRPRRGDLAGYHPDRSGLAPAARYEPELDEAEAERLRDGWRDALRRRFCEQPLSLGGESKSAAGHCGSSSSRCSSNSLKTAQREYHLRSAGTTNQGATSVEQRASASRVRLLVVVHRARSSISRGLNFQRLSGRSRRSSSRSLCSSREMWSITLTIVVPSSTTSRSNG